jgi:hypothetical protein
MVRVLVMVASLGLLLPIFSDDMESYKEGSDKYFQENVQKLQYGSLKEKIIAVENLRRVKSKRALRPFIFALKGTSTYGDAKPGVVQPEDPNIDQPVINVELSEHNDPTLKFIVSQAIADIGSERGMPALVEVYNAWEKKITKDEKVHLPVLDKMNNVNAVAEVLRSIGKLVSSLEDVEEAEGVKYRPAGDAIKLGMDTLKAALAHEHYYIRSSAADGLRYTMRKESFEIVNSVLANEKDDYVIASYLSAIINLKKSESDKFFDLVELLKSDRTDVRIRASMGLGSSDFSNAVHYIKQALTYEDNWNVRDQMKRDIANLSTYGISTAHSTGAYKDANISGNDSPTARQKGKY